MTPELLSQWVGTVFMGLLFWSLNRNVAALDVKLGELAGKVDSLHRAERDVSVRVAELAIRVQHTEAMLAHVELELEKLREARD